MTDDEMEQKILARFNLTTARTRGGLSAKVICGGSRCRDDVVQMDRVLKRLRENGTLAFTGGLWWKR
jgi:hypothetical protein